MLSNPLERTRTLLPRVAVRPADGLVVSETLPANPLTLLADIGVVHVTPGVQLTVTAAEGEIVKSLKLNVAVAEWLRLPLVAVIATLNVPADVDLHDTVEVCGDGGSVTLEGVTEQTSGAGAAAESVTAPANPLRPVTVTVEDAVVVPSAGAAAGADALIVKSTTWNRIAEVVWVRPPLVPVTVTV